MNFQKILPYSKTFFFSSTAGIKKFRCHFLKTKFEISLPILKKVSFHWEKSRNTMFTDKIRMLIYLNLEIMSLPELNPRLICVWSVNEFSYHKKTLRNARGNISRENR